MGKTRRETTVDTEDFTGHNRSNWEGVESIDEGLPDLDVATTLALIIEPINTGNVGAFMVSSKQEEVLRVFELVAHQQKDCLQTLLASVDIVTQEKVVGSRRESTHLEKSNKVSVLAVNIADNLHGGRQLQQSRL
jgi:hypothetical protein